MVRLTYRQEAILRLLLSGNHVQLEVGKDCLIPLAPLGWLKIDMASQSTIYSLTPKGKQEVRGWLTSG